MIPHYAFRTTGDAMVERREQAGHQFATEVDGRQTIFIPCQDFLVSGTANSEGQLETINLLMTSSCPPDAPVGLGLAFFMTPDDAVSIARRLMTMADVVRAHAARQANDAIDAARKGGAK